MIKPRVGCYGVYERTEEGWENAGSEFNSICEELREAGMEVVAAPELVCDEASCERAAGWFDGRDVDVLYTLIITWSFDHHTIMMQQRSRKSVIIRTIPGIKKGSVVGGQQLGCILADLGIEHKLFYGAIGNKDTAKDIAIYAKACALKNRLAGIKFAMLGRRTPGMTAIAFDEVEISRLFGIRVATIGMDEFERIAQTINIREIQRVWGKVSSKALKVESTDNTGLASIRNYLALRKMAAEENYKALTIGTYPDCAGSMCLPIAMLNDDGIAAGCEGDMNSTIAMYILGLLGDEPVHFGEMLEIDLDKNTIISSHCGAAAISLTDDEGYLLCPVRLANCGVCVRYASKTGPVTYVNLSGRKGTYRMCGLKGEALTAGMVFEGNPMKIKLETCFNDIWSYISDGSFGHHWMAAYGHVAAELKEFCGLTGIKGIFPDES